MEVFTLNTELIKINKYYGKSSKISKTKEEEILNLNTGTSISGFSEFEDGFKGEIPIQNRNSKTNSLRDRQFQ